MIIKIISDGLVQIIDNMITTTLKDGRLKHKIDGWTGYQNPNESMVKTKWYKDGAKYWEVKGSKNTYIVKTGLNNLLECECLGFVYRKNCKHIKEIVNKIRKNLDEL